MTMIPTDCKRRTIWAQRVLLLVLLAGLVVLAETAHSQRDIVRGTLRELVQVTAERDDWRQRAARADAELAQVRTELTTLRNTPAPVLVCPERPGHDTPIFSCR